MTRLHYNETMMELDCLRRMRAYRVMVGIEIANYNHLIDIAWLTDDQKIYAVELKLTDWKRALKQAQYHLEYVEFVSVAMPRKPTAAMKAAFISSGVGYLEYCPPDDFDGYDFSHPFVVHVDPVERECILDWDQKYRSAIFKRIVTQHQKALDEARKFVEAFNK